VNAATVELEGMMLQRLLVVLLILLGGCAAILYYNMGPTIACSLRSTDEFHPGLTLHSLNSGAVTRCYWLTLPAAPSAEEPMALIFSLHGFASNPRGQRRYSQWDEIASSHNAAVVYPQGSGFPLRWNSFAGTSPDAPDDVAFFRDMLAELRDALPIGPDQVYVTGFSNGAAMTLRLMCEAGELITAAGTVAAPVTSSIMRCELKNPVPLIAFHGSADPVLAIDGWDLQTDTSHTTSLPIRQGKLLGFEAWTKAWARKSGCDVDPTIIMNTAQVRTLRYAGGPDHLQLQVYTVIGSGHTWPGGKPIPFVGRTSKAISASEAMWAFFQDVGDR
jgi:polyhydroxybutyrate depolymerase